MYFFSGAKSIKKIWKDKAFYGKMPIDGLLPQITRHKATCCNIAEESMGYADFNRQTGVSDRAGRRHYVIKNRSVENNTCPFAFQKGMFCIVKGALLKCKRAPFAGQKGVFYNPIHNLLIVLKLQIRK